MFEVYRKEIKFGGKKLTFETGKVARQADGAVVVTYGGTTVLCTATASKNNSEADFFPLTVNYQEKAFSAGKIPGGFFKREGRPSEKETLTSRLIDRPIRPLFHKNFKRETQVIATVLEYDFENDPDIVAIIAASAALTLSGLPFMGPIGACRVGWDGKKYLLNPKIDIENSGLLDLVVAGTNEGVLMVESEANELNEKIMLGAVDFGHKELKNVIKGIIELAEVAAKEPISIDDDIPQEKDYLKVVKGFKKEIEKAYKVQEKASRYKELDIIKEKIKEEYKRSIAEVNCNAHAIRYFKEASITWKDECAPFLKLYNKIYELERQRKTRENSLTDKEKLSLRKQMIPHFIELKLKSEQTLPGSMAESSFRKAMNYFLNHYDGLTLCTTNIGIPLDNNHSEREVRSPVVGRKTWYGTHSKQGALTTAIHFSIVQSCKVNGINPRNYYPWVVERILHGKEPLTPNEYSNFKETR